MPLASQPKYEQVKQRIIAQIKARQWPVGSPFPSETQLLNQFKVSRPTLVRSLQELVRDGYIYRRKGQGTFVADYRAKNNVQSNIPVFISEAASQYRGDDRLVLVSLLSGIASSLAESPWSMQVHSITDQTRDALQTIIGDVTDGAALVIEPSLNPPMLCTTLAQAGWQVCSVNESCDSMHSIAIDQELAGFLATQYLIESGRTKIAMLNGRVEKYSGFAARRSGYLRAHQQAGIKANPQLYQQGYDPIDSESGRMMFRKLLDEKVSMDGVVCASDRKAIGAMAAALEAGVAVPENILFVGIDNNLADRAEPPLSAVVMPFEEVGFRAAKLAVSLLDPKATPCAIKTKMLLQPWLVQRGFVNE